MNDFRRPRGSQRMQRFPAPAAGIPPLGALWPSEDDAKAARYAHGLMYGHGTEASRTFFMVLVGVDETAKWLARHKHITLTKQQRELIVRSIYWNAKHTGTSPLVGMKYIYDALAETDFTWDFTKPFPWDKVGGAAMPEDFQL